MQDHKKEKKRFCQLLDVMWTTDSTATYFESGKKFCPTPTTGAGQNCKIGFFAKKQLNIFKKIITTTWQACRDLCNGKGKCNYFKWKVKSTLALQ